MPELSQNTHCNVSDNNKVILGFLVISQEKQLREVQMSRSEITLRDLRFANRNAENRIRFETFLLAYAINFTRCSILNY